MQLSTRIVVTPRYSSEYECDISLKRIEGTLYNVVIGQEIKLMNDGKHVCAKVIGVSDSVYDDAIYRYVEVIVIDTRI